jgi:tetratricopeptide (TPR) repeat protein
MQRVTSKYKSNFATELASSTKLIIALWMMVAFVGCKSKQTALVSKDIDPKVVVEPEVSRFPQNVQMAIDNAFLEGVKQMMIEDYGTALGIFFEVLKMDHQHAPANFQISKIRLMQNQANEAEIHAERAWRLSPNNKFYLEHLAEIYRHNHKFTQALNSYERLIKLDPKNEDDYLLEISTIYLLMRRPNDGILILDEIEKRRGVSEELSMQKIRIFQALGQENNLRNELQKLIQTFPSDTRYLTVLAELNLQTGRQEDALENFRNILSLDPENPMALAMYADFLRQDGRIEEARDKYRKVVAIDPSQYGVWEALLISNLMLLDSTKLLQDAEKALELFPEQPLVYYMLATAYNLKKDYVMAMQYLEQAGQMAISNKRLLAQIYGDLGDVYHHLGHHRKSDENFRKALEIEPENMTVLNNFAYFLSLRGENLDEAERMSRLVAQRNPDNPTFLDTFAWVLYKQGKYAEAKSVMELALEHGGNEEAVLLEHYGDILWKIGEKDRALDYWKKAQALEYSGVSEFLNEKIRTETLIEN